MTARRSTRCLVVAVSIRKIHESFAKACANVRRLSLIGHAIQTCDALEPLRKLVNLYDLTEKDRWAVCDPVCDVPDARIVCEDVCEGRLVYLDGVKVGGKEGTSMMERALEDETRRFETRDGEESVQRKGIEERLVKATGREVLRVETISGVHYELPKGETEHIKSLFRKLMPYTLRRMTYKRD